MPTERLSMRRIRELLRLKYENGLSSRTIAASLGISKGAVGAYGMSRAELFAAVDAPALKPLPAELYAFAVWKRCRVAPDYHVEADGNWFCALPADPRTRRCTHSRSHRRGLP